MYGHQAVEQPNLLGQAHCSNRKLCPFIGRAIGILPRLRFRSRYGDLHEHSYGP
jgi:hypothetical protein